MNPKELNLENVKFINDGERVETKLNIDKPSQLYKYYSLNNYSIGGLEKGSIYFSHVYLLNDIIDGELNLLWDFQDFVKNKKSDLKKIIQIPPNADEDKYIEQFIKRQIIPAFLGYRGVLSLTGSYKNELLWAHYCNEKGFCLEISTSKFEDFLKNTKGDENYCFFPISYGSPLKQINFDKYALIKKEKGDFGNGLVERNEVDVKLPILYGLATKDKHWEYENEWRILLRDIKFNGIPHPLQIIDDYQKEIENDLKSGGNVKIEQQVIEKIILAPLFFNNDRFNQKIEVDKKKNIVIYNIKKNDEGKLTKRFLETLKNNFCDKIFMIDKFSKDKSIERDITYRIDIIDIGNNYIKVQKLSL